MSDYFSTANLERGLSQLGAHNSDSLVDDPIFKVFRAALNEELSDLPNLWQDIFTYQVYPDLVEYLAPIDGFALFIHKYEPGIYIDYRQMRDDLHTHQNFFPGGQKTTLDMYDFLNRFNSAHITFIRSTISLLAWQLFAKMLDRFYGHIRDADFETFIKSTIEHISTKHWPSYQSVHSTIQTNIHTAKLSIQQATRQLIHLKNSPDLASFQAHISAATHFKSAATIEANAQSDLAATQILHKHVGPQTRALLSKRKSAIAQRNALTASHRMTKTRPLRQQNRQNIHQFGNMARVPLTDSVVRALSVIQEGYRELLFTGDEEEMVTKGVKGMSVAEKGEVEEMEEEMNRREPLGGILVGEGFAVVDVWGV